LNFWRFIYVDDPLSNEKRSKTTLEQLTLERLGEELVTMVPLVTKVTKHARTRLRRRRCRDSPSFAVGVRHRRRWRLLISS